MASDVLKGGDDLKMCLAAVNRFFNLLLEPLVMLLFKIDIEIPEFLVF